MWCGMINYLLRPVRSVFYAVCRLISLFNFDGGEIVLIFPEGMQGEAGEIARRAAFYLPSRKVITRMADRNQTASISSILSRTPYLTIGDIEYFPRWALRIRGGIFNVDYQRNHLDGWEWHYLLNYLQGDAVNDEAVHTGHTRFKQLVEILKNENLSKSYVFGTGPSLGEAINYDWSDGYRIVCNTIVRDEKLWNKIDPHIIVAGDAIYHFGDSGFSRAFRSDLKKRLGSSNAFFVYDALFHNFILKEFREFENRLIPVPVGKHKDINVNLCKNYNLPLLGNVLSLLLLPIACTLTRKVLLLGFDGKAPDDKLFWSNSVKHSYGEHLDDLVKSHPAFFGYYVPESEPQKYVKLVHGDLLDQKLAEAERDGWEFVSINTSWTSTIQKRHFPDSWPNKTGEGSS